MLPKIDGVGDVKLLLWKSAGSVKDGDPERVLLNLNIRRPAGERDESRLTTVTAFSPLFFLKLSFKTSTSNLTRNHVNLR